MNKQKLFYLILFVFLLIVFVLFSPTSNQKAQAAVPCIGQWQGPSIQVDVHTSGYSGPVVASYSATDPGHGGYSVDGGTVSVNSGTVLYFVGTAQAIENNSASTLTYPGPGSAQNFTVGTTPITKKVATNAITANGNFSWTVNVSNCQGPADPSWVPGFGEINISINVNSVGTCSDPAANNFGGPLPCDYTYTPGTSSAPSQPSVSPLTCASSPYSVIISWTGAPPPTGFVVDLSTTAAFTAGTVSTKNAGSSSSTTAPTSFSPSINLNPGTTYYTRVSNGSYSGVTSFSRATCPPGANLITSTKKIEKVNGAPFIPSVTLLNNGDVVTFKIDLFNTGNDTADIKYICDNVSPNFTLGSSFTTTGGSGSVISGAAGSFCPTTDIIYLTGNLNAGQHWAIRFDATFDNSGMSSAQLCSNTADVHYTDSNGNGSQSFRYGPTICNRPGSGKSVDFQEVGP